MTYTLVLLRHGHSEWNAKNLFTGWVDVDLNEQGVEEAGRGATLLADAGIAPDVSHTSLLRRAIRTSQIVLDGIDRHWIPVERSWRLNERHYGALQGKDKKATLEEYGEVQVYNGLLVANTDDTYSLSAGLLNTTDTEQTLESVTVSPLSGEGSVTAEPAVPVELAPRQLFTVGRAGELADIDGSAVELGRYAELTLTFSGAGEVDISVPIVARNASYADVAEQPAEATPSASPSASATPSPSATPSS
jgi:phosphohistidine phosphatase SixA